MERRVFLGNGLGFTAKKPVAVCDSCIVHAMNVTPAQVAQITGALGTTSDFQRDKGVCGSCNQSKTGSQAFFRFAAFVAGPLFPSPAAFASAERVAEYFGAVMG